MLNLIPKFRQSTIISEKPALYELCENAVQVICPEDWKLWRATATTEFNVFNWNLGHVSYLTMSTNKRVRDFFLFW